MAREKALHAVIISLVRQLAQNMKEKYEAGNIKIWGISNPKKGHFIWLSKAIVKALKKLIKIIKTLAKDKQIYYNNIIISKQFISKA